MTLMSNKHITPVLLALAIALPAAPMLAQQEEDTQDPGFLEGIIQNALGGDGREVRIIGLEGALSSEVKIATIEVADDQGTWLAINDVTMNWRRLALLRKRVEIDSLAIGSVDLQRAPVTPPPETPSIEAEAEPAAPFALPELPVSIELGQLSLAELDLGAALVGQDAQMSIEGAARLIGGEGNLDLRIERTDAIRGLILVDTGYVNETRQLTVNLDVEEDQGGLIATLAKFPGAPSVDLSVKGDAPLSDFTADIQLATDGQERLAGQVEVGQSDGTAGPVVTVIDADLGGDITPLFVPEYRDFFGTDVGLEARVELNPEAGTQIPQFNLSSRALNLTGNVALDPGGLPRLVSIRGGIGTGDDQLVTLPVPGAETRLLSADLSVDYDASQGDTFAAKIALSQLRQGEIFIAQSDLDLDGTLERSIATADTPAGLANLASHVAARLDGISVGDPALDSTIQPVAFDADLNFDAATGAVAIRNLGLSSGDLSLQGILDVAGVQNGDIEITTDAQLSTGDLARFAPIVAQPLEGRFDGAVKARFAALTGAFDVDLSGDAQDLAIGNPQLDPLIAGASRVALKAGRSASGIRLEELMLETAQITAQGTGELSSSTADLDLTARLAEANLVAPQLSGPLELSAGVSGAAPDYRLELDLGGEAITAQLGDPVSLSSDIAYVGAAGTVDIRNLALRAGDLAADGTVWLSGLKDDALAADAELSLDTGDLSRFSGLTGMPLAGQLAADLEGSFDSIDTSFGGTLAGTGRDIAIGNAQIDPLLAGETVIDIAATGAGTSLDIERLDIHNPALALTGAGQLSPEAADLDLRAWLGQINPFVPHLDGPVEVTASATGTAPNFAVTLDAGGAAITDKLGSPVSLDTNLVYAQDSGTLDIPDLHLSAGDLTATGEAALRGLNAALSATAELALDTGDLSRLAGLAGMPLAGTLTADVSGGFDSATGDFDGALTGNGQDIAIGNPQVDQLLDGTTRIDAAARRRDGTITIERLEIDNPDLQVQGGGTYAPEGGDLDLTARLADLGLFVPQLSGPLTVEGNARGAGSAWTVDLGANGPAGLRAQVSGDVAPTNLDIDIDAGISNIGVFVPQIPGPASVSGKVSGNGTDFFTDITATGPGGLSADIDGRAWGPDGTSDLGITGRIPLTLANAFIAPRSLTGAASIDLRLAGAPGLDALSGTVGFAGARFVDPTSRIVLNQMALDLGFAQSRANLDFRAALETGGTITVSGPVDLAAPFNGDIAVALNQLKLVDPSLYTIDLGGRIDLEGPLAGGASINGQIDIDRAEIEIPSAMGGGGPIPDMTHVGEPSDSRATRDRAGLIQTDAGDGTTGAPVAYPLDVTISAPARIFVRGRGLDTEFGGSLNIGGTTQRIIPSGRFEVVRGRMDILTQVLNLDTAEITLGGDLVPDVYMVATSQDAPIDAQILIEGPVNDPELEFSSSPELPEDEVLSHLFFGRPISELSPLEVAQLLSAINTLTGGGGGVFGKLRDGVGVDQLNVGADDDGNTEVTAGKYLSEDVYTDVTVGAGGTSRVRLNYEITPSLTARGGFDSEGDTRLGFSFERDY
ncbi:translocation/assembly module TamB domain-containing protein [Mangrovicoccus algicola]|uniref:Translocation/assembly module TamB domain-containing protein n=1 Tax=Mangrovicoccus algicola TaxID=2771008 RepID=A0A8J6Z9Q5_9RHOB|nr:translocation/assembly module TamB domain-containing protein [Mangrovicoccus algicola]MBE3638621.1 translocation/assembly module TamB domain-containing protein [Mangrovicoccus algicola]